MNKLIFGIAVLILVACNQNSNSNEQKKDSLSEAKVVELSTFIRAETDRAFLQMIENAGQTNSFFTFEHLPP